MIINIRGTGGSGKSTLVRTIMALYPGEPKPIFIDGRKKPAGYETTRPSGNPLWVPGHYETACGGCDTYKTVEDVFTSVRSYAKQGFDVLFEGIMAQDAIARLIDLHREFPYGQVVTVALDIPIETSLAGIRARREARGDEKPLNEKNTRSRAEAVRRSLPRLKDAGVDVRRVSSREDGFEVVKKLLGWL